MDPSLSSRFTGEYFATREILPDQGVDFADFDVVQLFNSSFDLMLVGLQVGDKNQSIVIFDLLHSRLGGQGMLDDAVGIHAITRRRRLPRVLGVPGRSEGLGPPEVDGCTGLLHPGAMSALNDLLLDLLGLLHRP